jgi:transposase InsO family protein
MSHANAQLTPAGRLRLARLVVDRGWPLRRAAERWNCSVTTAQRWAERYRQHGPAGMGDRSSRPRSCPSRLPRKIEHRIVGLRISRRWGPARIAYRLGLNVSTVQRVLHRYGCPPLRWTDPATGVRIRSSRQPRHRYEMPAPGDLVHIDVKKLGKIPNGGGHRFLGRQRGRANTGVRGRGYGYIHNAVDDHSRLAYCEILADERKETTIAFWHRARAWFARAGIEVKAVMTDNGSAYKSKDFAAALGDVRHVRTRPYRPQSNGKVERLNRTMLEEWAYARAYRTEDERRADFEVWLHTYNHHRGHTSLGGAVPADRVPNLSGQNT